MAWPLIAAAVVSAVASAYANRQKSIPKPGSMTGGSILGNQEQKQPFTAKPMYGEQEGALPKIDNSGFSSYISPRGSILGNQQKQNIMPEDLPRHANYLTNSLGFPYKPGNYFGQYI